ncbi:MAG: hypothetical protein M1829_001555 [Trizodia sp. TS-e1964]|nr:MAG: hypothetical protein M1829_001555 [Trizodia sp. TS-e1964]
MANLADPESATVGKIHAYPSPSTRSSFNVLSQPYIIVADRTEDPKVSRRRYHSLLSEALLAPVNDEDTPAAEKPHIRSISLELSKPLSNDHFSSIIDQSLIKNTVDDGPLSAGLRLQTDLEPQCSVLPAAKSISTPPSSAIRVWPNAVLASSSRTPSFQGNFSSAGSNFGSLPGSAFSSPALAAMTDITPLPSPLFSSDPLGPWGRYVPPSFSEPGLSSGATTTEAPLAIVTHPKPRKTYPGLLPVTSEPYVTGFYEQKKRNLSAKHSLGELITPEPLQHLKPHSARSSGIIISPPETGMKREEYLANHRGLVGFQARPPTPPASNRSGAESDSDSSLTRISRSSRLNKKPQFGLFRAEEIKTHQKVEWRAIRQLGQGAFSKVFLATSQGSLLGKKRIDEENSCGSILGSNEDDNLDQKSLVAIKIVEHGPAGGASEERVDSSLKREMEIMKSIHHPSIVHLKAYSIEATRTLLVLGYCSGGDLFDISSNHLLPPILIQRIFAELVAATRYLHSQDIVHRDIKLENVLINLKPDILKSTIDWHTYPTSVSTLSDLGLSRRIDPNNPILKTRCGSDDYVSPELVMTTSDGDGYDGFQNDAWALGVLLYSLMEGRLPFDSLPGSHNMRSRTTHRVARCDWQWVKFADKDGEPIDDFGELQGAREVVEGLLQKRSRRWSLEKVASHSWLSSAISVEGGLKCMEGYDN